VITRTCSPSIQDVVGWRPVPAIDTGVTFPTLPDRCASDLASAQRWRDSSSQDRVKGEDKRRRGTPPPCSVRRARFSLSLGEGMSAHWRAESQEPVDSGGSYKRCFMALWAMVSCLSVFYLLIEMCMAGAYELRRLSDGMIASSPLVACFQGGCHDRELHRP